MHFRNKFIPYYQKLSFILYWFFNTFNPVQDGIFLGCSRMGGGIAKRPHLPKICCTYPTMMKHGTVIPYLKEIQNTPLYFCWHQHFFTGNQQILLYQGIQIQIPFRCILLILLTFLESLRIVLINVVKIVMMSAKMATSSLLKIKIFWKKIMTS